MTETTTTSAPSKAKTIEPVDANVDSPLTAVKGDPHSKNPGFVDEKGNPAGWRSPEVKAPKDIEVKPGDYTSALTWEYVSASGSVKRSLEGEKIAHTDITEHDARVFLGLGYIKQ